MMLEDLDNYDWHAAFAYAGEQGGGATCVKPPTACEGAGEVRVCPVTRYEVAEILAMSEGRNDEQDWLGLFRLHDGRFLYLEAGCDYTGWG